MTDIQLRSDIKVEYIDHMGSDTMIAKAARVSTGKDQEDNDKITGLINYLARERHTSPFEHTALTVRIEAPIFVAREAMRHRTFCIAGDTEITFGNQSATADTISTYRKTIAEHWEHWHKGVLDSKGRRRILPTVKNARVVSLNESTKQWELQHVVDVIQSGVKPVFRLTTERGFSIKATELHRFLTPQGWKKLADLSVDDMVYVQRKGYKKPKAKVPRDLRVAINSWSRSHYETLYENQHSLCAKCSETITKGVVDHRVPVALDLTKALDVNNLQVLCLSCDRGKTDEEQKLADRGGEHEKVSGERIVSIEYVGNEMTYDLSVEAPHHNFLGNGIVVHNSYNEVSGRYAKLKPEFYVPDEERPLINTGSGAHPNIVFSTDDGLVDQVGVEHEHTYEQGWYNYETMLEQGVATEVARNVLPVGTYTSWYMTGNLHAWFNFLYLRDGEVGHPQKEIVQLAQQVWPIIEEHWPIAAKAWKEKNG